MKSAFLITACMLAATAQAEGRVISGMKVNPRPKQPHTSFQTHCAYTPELDVRTDAVIHYGCGKEGIQSWLDRGYVVQTMYGFRTGPDYIKEHADEGQTNAEGVILTCGPGSYYMVPTQSRIDAALNYYRQAIKNGTSMAVPEEPEFFTQAGYSESFKKEWQAYYNEPWQDQTTSVEARWKSSRLKGYLEYRMVKSILEDAKKQDPDVIRAVAVHSPVSYYLWGIIYPHHEVMKLPELTEMIGQVWTGTARSGCRYEGLMAERTFENAYLEYSSLYNLMRGTGKRVWFLMDPLEDNPDRSMEDYQTNYEKTLVASLMFPEVDEYEVMPWPERIFGRVPPEFATKIMTIVTMLGDMHNQKDSELDAGTQGIATFVADSMAWQRGEPHASDFDSFYGLTLPLLMKGIPVQVAQLERTPEPKYLDPYKVLLLSYDMMKPMDAAYNLALAKWVRSGGTLVLFGGADAYNDVPEWWQKAGFRSPQDHLLAELGVRIKSSISLPAATFDPGAFKLLAEETNRCRDQENRQRYTFDVTDYVQRYHTVYIKLEDAFKDDGWGPLVFGAKLKFDGYVGDAFEVGTENERHHIYEDRGSVSIGNGRFADGNSYWIYRLGWRPRPSPPENAKLQLSLDMANQFKVSVATAPPHGPRRFSRTSEESSLASKHRHVSVPPWCEVTACDTDATRLYSLQGADGSPFFETNVGKGTLIFCGIAPKYFASSRKTADLLRAIVAGACEKAGIAYKEQHYMRIRRGRYIAVRAFDKPVELKGRFVNVLDPGLGFVEDPKMSAGELAVMADVGKLMADSKPRVLLSSNRIEASGETATSTRLLLSGPLKTKGIVRISTAGKQVKAITVEDTSGNPIPFEQQLESGTVAVTYDSRPDGVSLHVGWVD